MPRSRGGPAPAPRRPVAAAPPARAPTHQQTRPASTAAAAHPPTAQAGAPTSQQGPGLFGQMASTAAGVAVGSSIGHAIGGFFGGGSNAAAPQAPVEQQSVVAAQDPAYASQAQQGPCVGQVANFRQCMDQQNGDMNVCGWYLDQLKACQQAASQY